MHARPKKTVTGSFLTWCPRFETPPLRGSSIFFYRSQNGEFILHGIAFAQAANANTSSLLHGRVDLDNVVVAGHSMGATCR